MKITPQWLRWPETQRLIAAFDGKPLRFVGGCVRDALLERKVSDVDAATSLVPQDVMALLKQAGIKAIPTGIEHGTVTAVVDGKPFEITTLRLDVSTDGRRATVAFSEDWREDAARRDFTMNALYCDVAGGLTDYFGGIADAQVGRVRFIGDAQQRICEDALRILRFFRFYAYYGKGAPDGEGIAAIAQHAGLIEALSGERIRQEMLKLLLSPKAAIVVEQMQQAGVLFAVLGANVTIESLMLLPALQDMANEAPDAILTLAALLRSSGGDGAADVARIHERWKLSNAQHKQLQRLCTTKLQLTEVEALTKRQIRVLGREDFIQLMLLYAAEGAQQEPVLAAIGLARAWEIPVFPVNGDDLKARGVTEGKKLGETLKTLEAQWEKGGYTATKEDLLRQITP